MCRPNLLTVLGVHQKEDVISNILKHCYNSSPSFRHDMLRALHVPASAALLEGCAHTRVGTGDSGIPDIVIVGKQSNQHELLIIENKIGAEEGDDQTQRYSSVDCRDVLARKYGLDTTLLEKQVY